MNGKKIIHYIYIFIDIPQYVLLNKIVDEQIHYFYDIVLKKTIYRLIVIVRGISLYFIYSLN